MRAARAAASDALVPTALRPCFCARTSRFSKGREDSPHRAAGARTLHKAWRSARPRLCSAVLVYSLAIAVDIARVVQVRRARSSRVGEMGAREQKVGIPPGLRCGQVTSVPRRPEEEQRTHHPPLNEPAHDWGRRQRAVAPRRANIACVASRQIVASFHLGAIAPRSQNGNIKHPLPSLGYSPRKGLDRKQLGSRQTECTPAEGVWAFLQARVVCDLLKPIAKL